jgi:hypothetical protein
MASNWNYTLSFSSRNGSSTFNTVQSSTNSTICATSPLYYCPSDRGSAGPERRPGLLEGNIYWRAAIMW